MHESSSGIRPRLLYMSCLSSVSIRCGSTRFRVWKIPIKTVNQNLMVCLLIGLNSKLTRPHCLNLCLSQCSQRLETQPPYSCHSWCKRLNIQPMHPNARRFTLTIFASEKTRESCTPNIPNSPYQQPVPKMYRQTVSPPTEREALHLTGLHSKPWYNIRLMGSYSRQRASTTTFSCKCSNEEQDDGSVVIASSWKELWGCLCGLIQVHSMHERGYLQVCLTWVVWASSLQDAAVLGLGFGGIPVNCLQNLMVLWVIGLIWIMQKENKVWTSFDMWQGNSSTDEGQTGSKSRPW